ncbi:hypothetical protein GEOBRER4_n3362 [Citrifermentans bremense]|uniref:DUF2917 domain-containing protein n=1 Tax=Citrifermentans bremense TaxID=60035 RepID=A0A6S6M472_9BACT|nr:DUF2917 domain-containing protein [Citrifermentans bremense]BCG48470.1 hypothetical protein GEOBRER4_n3362 [Citrifermentans bremense]
MNCSLDKGELLQLEAGKGALTLRCLKGTIWLTVGDGRDYLLQAGARFEVKKGMPALAEALAPVEMRLDSPCHSGAAIAPVAHQVQVRPAV